MFQSWKSIFFIVITALLLTACGQSTEERAAAGVKSAGEAFYANNAVANEEVEGTKFYKPVGFKIEEDSDAQNIVLNKSDDTFILFINPNEKSNSRLFYDLLIADEKENIIKEEVFTEGDTVGFAAVIQNENDDKVELVVSVGGVKMSTRVNAKKIKAHLPKMMEVVRSIK